MNEAETGNATRATINGYFSSLSRKAAWESFFSEEMAFTSFTSLVRRSTGREAYLEATKRFYSTIVAVSVRSLLIDENRACALTHYELQPPGRPAFTTDVAEVFEIHDQKITLFEIYFDTAPFPK